MVVASACKNDVDDGHRSLEVSAENVGLKCQCQRAFMAEIQLTIRVIVTTIAETFRVDLIDGHQKRIHCNRSRRIAGAAGNITF